jgi:hypothetical protein
LARCRGKLGWRWASWNILGLIVPGALHWRSQITVVAAALLAIESLVFVWVHVRYHEMTPLILSAVLGVLMAFVAYGRIVLSPIV